MDKLGHKKFTMRGSYEYFQVDSTDHGFELLLISEGGKVFSKIDVGSVNQWEMLDALKKAVDYMVAIKEIL